MTLPSQSSIRTTLNQTIAITPVNRGSTQVHVTIRDAESSSDRSFEFSVGDVTKTRTIAANMAAGDAIALVNSSEEPVAFTLEHNDFPMFLSDQDVVEFVRAMAPDYADEPFERKLWRFIRDNVYHTVPLTADKWLYDPWVTVNSLGWGFCGHVSATYVRLARAAGFESRVWGLTGHVVPEIKIAGHWEVYDPDLAVYYFNGESVVAGIDDLTADPSLITSPLKPIFVDGSYTYPYSTDLANIYGTTSDNFAGDATFLAESPSQYQPLVLPAGARLVYPGKWSRTVTGVDDKVPYDVPYYLQAMLTTPAAWRGNLSLPWMIWEIRGTGRVRVLGNDYDVGSTELANLLQKPGTQIPSIEVVSSTTDLEFVVFINAMRYGLGDVNTIRLKGQDVWAIQVGTEILPGDAWANPLGAAAHKKPTP